MVDDLDRGAVGGGPEGASRAARNIHETRNLARRGLAASCCSCPSRRPRSVPSNRFSLSIASDHPCVIGTLPPPRGALGRTGRKGPRARGAPLPRQSHPSTRLSPRPRARPARPLRLDQKRPPPRPAGSDQASRVLDRSSRSRIRATPHFARQSSLGTPAGPRLTLIRIAPRLMVYDLLAA